MSALTTLARNGVRVELIYWTKSSNDVTPEGAAIFPQFSCTHVERDLRGDKITGHPGVTRTDPEGPFESTDG